jgi:ubiquinone biosynthesis UbiH/UbiF/VisC/COQ6 family hydroxylase
MSMHYDVLIVGAGLVGASLACALRPAGLRTALLDAELPPEPSRAGWDSRVYAISPGSRDFLRACGAWERLPHDRIAAVEGMQVYGDDGKAEIVFSAYECGIRELCVIVEGREIQRALGAALAQCESVTTLFGRSPVALAVDESGLAIDLADAETIEARLLIGADGPKSWVREAAGIEQSGRSYGQSALVANFETERNHDAIARQWFLAEGVLALLPLPANRVSLVWSAPEALAERLLSFGAYEFAHEVASACGFALGEMRVITAPRAFPLRLMRAQELVRPWIALVGDAAHVLHPLAGQGLNLGFRDVAELASVLCARGAQDDCGDHRLLRRYARARAEAITAMQWTTDGLQRLFTTRAPGVRPLRNAGLRWTNRVSALKNVLVEHALA